MLLVLRLLEHLVAQLLARRAALGDHALCFDSRGVERLRLFGEVLGSRVAIGLCVLDRLLERCFACLDRRGERLERKLGENDEEHQEDEQRPEHEARVRGQQVYRFVGLLFLGENRSCGNDGRNDCGE